MVVHTLPKEFHLMWELNNETHDGESHSESCKALKLLVTSARRPKGRWVTVNYQSSFVSAAWDITVFHEGTKDWVSTGSSLP